MDHFVITLTRRCGSGGMSNGRLLAEHYGVPVYDNKILTLASDDSGINEQLFADADESMKQSLLYKVSRGVYKGELIPPESDDFTTNENLFNYQAKIIRSLAEEGSCIIIGRCADHILKDMDGVVRVFVHAPEDFCLREAMKVNSLPENEVKKLIAKTDDYRARYYKYYTGQEWKNALNYDLSLDSSRLGFDGTVEAIKAYIEVRKRFDEKMKDE